jgi:allophanate hydrolase
MDLCGIAVPAGFRPDGLPFGVTFIGPAWTEAKLTRLAGEFLGESVSEPGDGIKLAVVGAHLRGQPLNKQLLELGAVFIEETRTAPSYRLFALPNTSPPKPGLVREDEGSEIEVEVWSLTAAAFGRFVAAIPAPLGIGTVQLRAGETVKGFLCESHAVRGAEDISHFGGWRGYLFR